MKPIKDNIILEMIPREDVTNSGIILSVESKIDESMWRKAIVKEIGERVNKVKPNDYVIVPTFSGMQIREDFLERRDIVMIKESDISLILEHKNIDVR